LAELAVDLVGRALTRGRQPTRGGGTPACLRCGCTSSHLPALKQGAGAHAERANPPSRRTAHSGDPRDNSKIIPTIERAAANQYPTQASLRDRTSRRLTTITAMPTVNGTQPNWPLPLGEAIALAMETPIARMHEAITTTRNPRAPDSPRVRGGVGRVIQGSTSNPEGDSSKSARTIPECPGEPLDCPCLLGKPWPAGRPLVLVRCPRSPGRTGAAARERLSLRIQSRISAVQPIRTELMLPMALEVSVGTGSPD